MQTTSSTTTLHVRASAYKFTGKERDTESGLDYFGARYYSSNAGRWMTPDWADKPEAVPYSDLTNPQSLNLYGYVNNNPLSRADADGHCFPFCESILTAVDLAGRLGAAVNKGLASLGQQVIASANDSSGQSQQLMVLGAAVGVVTPIPATSAAAEAEEMSSGTAVRSAATQLELNKAQGLAFQDAVAAETAQINTNVVQNVTLKTQNGVKTVMDVVSKDGSGKTVLQEAKSSATAPLTRNQAAAHPEIAKTGATVAGRGKPGFPGGTKIPPTNVQVVRPKPNQQ